MKRTSTLTIIVACLLAGSAFAASQKTDATSSMTVVPTAQATTSTAKVGATTENATVSSSAQTKGAAVAESPDHKSSALAHTLAIFPGIAIHGAGNMYAGSWMKGLGLFVVGTGGAYLAYDQANAGYNEIQSTFTNLHNNGNSGISLDYSGVFGRIGLILVGTAAFIWTGWDDIAGCGIAVDEYNKRADDAAAHVELLPTNGGAVLAYTNRF